MRVYRGLTKAALVKLWRQDNEKAVVDRLLHGPLFHDVFDPTFNKWRFYNDGTEAGATAKENEDTNHTTPSLSADYQIQLRARIQENGAGSTSGATTDDYGLEYSLNSGAYTAVTASSTHVQADTGSSLTDGGASTNRLTAGSGSFVAGEQEAANGVVEDRQLTADNYTEHVWGLKIIESAVSNGDTIDFRITLNAGAPGMTNSVTPRITVTKPAAAFALDHVEKFSVSFASGDTSKTFTLVTTLTDKNKSFMVVGVRCETPIVSRWMVRWEITNTTTLTFTRTGSGVALEIIGYVIEGSAGIAVDHGQITGFDVTNPKTAALSNVTDITKAFLVPSFSSGSSTWDGDDEIESWLSAGNVNAQMNTAAAAAVFNYQAVQMSNVAVQRGTITTWSTTSTTATLSPAVVLAKTFMMFSARHGNGAGNGLVARWRLRGRITSTTQLTFDRDDATSNINSLRWEAVEFTDDTVVDEVLSSFTSNGDGTDQTNNETIALSSTAKAIALGSFHGRMGKGAYDNSTDGQVESIFTFDITSTTNLAIRRDSSYSTADVAAYVIEFEPTAGIKTFALASSSVSAAAVGISKTLVLALSSSSPSAASVGLSATRPFASVIASDSVVAAALAKAIFFALSSSSASAVAATISRAVGMVVAAESSSTVSAAIIKNLVLAAQSVSISSTQAILNATRPLAASVVSDTSVLAGLSVTRALALASISASSVAVAITITTGGVSRTFALVCDSASAAVIVANIERNLAAILTSDSIIDVNIIETKSFSAASTSVSIASIALDVSGFVAAAGALKPIIKPRRRM